jgi:hypothetical protein
MSHEFENFILTVCLERGIEPQAKMFPQLEQRSGEQMWPNKGEGLLVNPKAGTDLEGPVSWVTGNRNMAKKEHGAV